MKKPGKESRGKETPRKQKSAVRRKPSQPPVKKSLASTAPIAQTPGPAFPIVGIGASAGGLDAFTQLLKHLPTGTGMGFVLVQHLDPDHESALAQILARVTSMPVREGANELRIAPNHVYIIPPNTDMATAQGVLKLQRRKAGRAPHHSVDFFFESLAKDQHECAIGVILSGTASDGTLGMEAIKAEGGITFAQDESARYDSMPRSAIAAGCVDFVLPPENIAKELARIARHPYVAGQPLSAALSPPEGEKKGEGSAEQGSRGKNGFQKILFLLRNHSGVDFSLYKSKTVHRRIDRRMLLNKIDRPEAYASLLRGNPKELEALYSDLLINVTSFFRNPEAFEVLKAKVFPKLIQQPRDKSLRIWVPGCSTGQEAYSIAMSFVEVSEQAGHARKLQLFATDLNEAVLDKARAGSYAKNFVNDLSPERLRRFFVKENGDYRVAKFLREMVVFARQNLLTDPPFSQMDLVSCRNLLIYLEQDLQRKILPTFHYALKPGGFLFLGESESTGSLADLFETVDKKHKIFSKKPGLTVHPHFVPRHPADKKEIPTRKPPGAPEGFPTHVDTQREADRVTLKRFAPPSVLIDAQLRVLQFRGETSPFLKPPSGNASFDVLKMAREGLMLPMRAAIKKAQIENKAVRREGVRLAQNGGSRTLNFEVIPLTHLKQRCCLIFFEEAKKGGLQTASASEVEQAPKNPKLSRSTRTKGRAPESRRVAELERELAEQRDYTQSLQEQHEAANEELQSSNEEVTSANEELQSINEELETSKEELESTNEELTTVNDEMVNRNAELNRSNADLNNLHTSVNMAILVLTRDLAIRRFTPQAGKLFNLLATDVGRPLSNVRHNLDLPGLEQLLQEVIDTISEREQEVQDTDGRWYSLRARPYLTLDNKIDGVVLVLADIDTLKRSEQEIAAARDYAEAILRTTRYPLVVLTAELRVSTANAAFYKTFKVLPGETNGRLIYEVGNGQWNIPKLREFLEDILPRNSFFDNFEVTHDFESIGRRTMLLNARRLNTDERDAPEKILLAIDDITDGKQLEAVRLSEIRYRRLFEAAKDGVLIVDAGTHRITDANPFMTELLGYTRDEFLEKELFEVGLFQNRAACEAAFRKWHEKRVFRDDELQGQTKAGERLKLELVGNLYEEAGRQVIQCNIRDITERRHVEEDRKELLAREQEARQQAEAANRAKDDFLATVSHELRTPLNPILGWSTLLRDQKLDDATSVRALESIQRNAKVQAQLIEDILDVSRVITGKLGLDVRPVDLTQVIDAAIDTARPAADAKSIQIQTHCETDVGLVSGDPGRLQQVVWNLLSNAVKFTPNGGRVDIRLERPNSDVQITVSDTGKGISADFLPLIFDRFRQADSTSTRKYGGLGLGLAIVRQIIEMHGGTVQAESRGEGQGATFTVRIPIRGIGDKEDTTPTGGLVFPTVAKVTPFVCPPQIYGLRVLLVDDQPDTLEMLKAALKQHCRAEVRTSADAATALEVFQQWKPDVLVSDIAMPGEDGYALITKVRTLEQQAGKRTPAIALTAYVRIEDRARVLQAGYDRFVPKPVEPSELLATLASLISAE